MARRNKITKSEWGKIFATSGIIATLFLLRHWLATKLPQDWLFVLGVLDTTTAFMFLPLFFFIFKELGVKLLKR